YQSRQSDTASDTSDLISHVRKNAASLKIDENKIAVWACSANVRVGLPLVMESDRKYIRAAVFYYGVMGETPVRQDVPVLVVRAGLDNPNLNAGIDNFVRMAVSEDVPLSFINYPEGRHAFDILDDNDTSRDIIQQTLDFMKFHVTKAADANHAAGRAPSPSRFLSMVSRQGVQKAIQVYRDARKTDPQAPLFQEATLNNLGYQLLQNNAGAAVEIFKLNVEAHPNSANVYDSLADGFEAAGNRELAIENAERALAVLAKDTVLPEAQKANIRTSAEDKLRRLKPQK
ncbi:MAG TPA: tetratricopeptide repeat protein, partial [Blastocatellia bacterium]|nr:tetratricopeptide repeat protein [Blastocatellia bacterium]